MIDSLKPCVYLGEELQSSPKSSKKWHMSGWQLPWSLSFLGSAFCQWMHLAVFCVITFRANSTFPSLLVCFFPSGKVVWTSESRMKTGQKEESERERERERKALASFCTPCYLFWVPAKQSWLLSCTDGIYMIQGLRKNESKPLPLPLITKPLPSLQHVFCSNHCLLSGL